MITPFNSFNSLKILIVQPHRPQEPAPYGKVVGGVDFLADADTGLYQLVLCRILFLCRRPDSKDIQRIFTDLKVLYGFYG